MKINFNSMIKKLRKKHAMSLKEIAEGCDVSLQYIHKMEKGQAVEPSYSVGKRIINFYEEISSTVVENK